MNDAPTQPNADERAVEELARQIIQQAPPEAAALLGPLPDDQVVAALRAVSPAVADDILVELGDERRRAVLAAARPEEARQWSHNLTYPEESVGRLMESPRAVFRPELTVAETIEQVRELVRNVFVTYGFVTDASGRLVGIITMRDLLLSERSASLGAVMLRDPFSLRPEMPVIEAMRLVLTHHFPVYPVCDASGRLVGIVRGRTLFEEQAFEISAQAGSMVGVEKEERLSTPWVKSLRFRHPWLQLNLVTAFLAAGVVGFFQDTIDRIVVLAVFLPVLAGQSGNTGCQALAVALRGLTLGELKPGRERVLVMKEALLGLLNGGLVGISAGIGMWIVASAQGNPHAPMLAFIVLLAMIGSCVISGLSGALIPLTLRRLGADPATASSIFLTTATDVASMGIFLALATWLVL
jgi:magnesium transporter